MNKIIMMALALTIIGCSTAGVKNQEFTDFEKSTTLNISFDNAWGAVMEWAAINDYPIESVDKVSGIIVLRGSAVVSRSFMAEGDTAIEQVLVSCGDPTGNIGLYKGKFHDLDITTTVILRELDSKLTRVTVNLRGDALVQVRNLYGVVSESTVTCPSKGVLEEQMFSDLKAF